MSEAPPAKRSPQDRRRQLEALLQKKAEKSRSFPLSFAQQRLWLLEQLEPGNPIYNIPLVIRLTGELDVAALNRTINEVVVRHESLRTRIAVTNDQPVQVVDAPKRHELPIVDLQHLDPAGREAEALAMATAEVRKPFRLDQSPLFRTLLVRLSPTEHVMTVVMHHIISDDWSMGVLFHDVARLYKAFTAGQLSPLEKLPIQYADYAVWQRRRLQGEPLQELLDYWGARLKQVAPLEMPTEQGRSFDDQQSGATETVLFPSALAERLHEIARREGATLYMILLAAFQVLLHRYSGQEDFAVGSPIAGRIGKETEGLVGFFVNTLVLRASLAGNPTFRQLLGQVRQTALEAFQHQELPFERLVEALNPERDTRRHPLFQVMFTLQSAPWPDVKLAGLSLSVIPLDTGTSPFDLSLTAREEPAGLSLAAEYSTHLFRPDMIRRLLGHFQVLLEGIVADPDRPIAQLPLLGEAERRALLVERNQTQAEYSGRSVHELFEEQAARTPMATAVVFEGQSLTYGELNARANRLARYLQARGVGPDQLVAVRLPRCLELITALLGVLKAGGAYLPLDPLLPAERLRFTLADAKVDVIVTEKELQGDLPAGPRHVICMDTDWQEITQCSAEPLSQAATGQQLAYVIYTSGSTGQPKGVMIEHRALLNYTHAVAAAYGITAADRVLQFASVSFDAHAEEVYPCLTRGGTLFLRNDEMLDCRRFLQLCGQWQVTFLSLPTGFWHELTATIAAEQFTAPSALRLVAIGGEQAQADRVATWFQCLGDRVRLLNTYGPTEATVVATTAELSRADGRVERVPIGQPLANYRAYVLDRSLQPVPAGVHGELYLGGESLARGYLNRPELTAERFVPDPFAPGDGARMYKTGDVVRWGEDSRLEFVGRTDHQVKIRGFRIELGEVETVLRQCAGVRDAVVTARDDLPGGKQLVAYIVADGQTPPAAEDMRQFLSGLLPDYMVPAIFAPLPAIPLNSSGKVDYRALPRPERQRDARRTCTPPRNADEQALADIWCEVLQLDQVGRDDNFFALGGHSLLATQVVSRIARRLHVDVPLRDIFQTPTIADLGACVAALRARGGTSGQPIPLASREGQLPASFTQEALWFLDQLEHDRATYTAFPSVRMKGPLDVAALERAFGEIIRRHESLRTRFPEADGRPIQVIDPPEPQAFSFADLSGLSAVEREVALDRAIAQQAGRPIDLQKGPVLRMSVLKMSEDEHVLLAAAHHMIYDGWSLGIMARELAALYPAYRAGHPSPLPELSIQYADFAAWQRDLLQGETLNRLRTYWIEHLDGVPPLELPTDYPRPAVRTTRGDTLPCNLSPELSTAVREFCRREGVTPFMALLAAFQVLLQRYTGQDDFAIGSPVANRMRPETESLIGYFINVVVLRGDLSGDIGFRGLIERVRQVALGAFEHQELTLDRVVDAVKPARDPSRHPLFQAMFVLQNTEPPSLRSLGLEIEPFNELPAGDSAYFELTMSLEETDQGYHGSLNFNTDLFRPETATRMIQHYQTLLAAAIADPDRPLGALPLLGQDERRTLVDDWNGAHREYPQGVSIHELFESQVERTPDAVALVDGPRQWTYRELNERANRLAHYLQARGVGADHIVAVRLPRSAELIVGLWGVLKAGGAYLPLDPKLPAERLRFTLEDARVDVVLTVDQLRGDLPDGPQHVICLDTDWQQIALCPAERPVQETRDDHLAYVIYTSGSTGQPKGVMLEHRALVNYAHAVIDEYEITAADRVLQFASVSFDAHAEEIYPCLIVGGTLVLRSDDMLDCKRFLELCAEWQLTFVTLPTGFWHELTTAIATERFTVPATLRLLVIGGEAVLPDRVATWFESVGDRVRLLNTYGPTETTVVATVAELSRADSREERMPIGRPLANYRSYVLDRSLQPVPVGVRGELYVGGASLARGYLNRPELTAERFVPDPFGPDGRRMYKTGDVVRWRRDGRLEFVGRTDHQVKIRGFRIEPGEVEQVLREYPLLADAAVVPRYRAPGDLQLVAYTVAQAGDAPTAAEMRQFLRERLPEFMIPATFMAIESMPMTTSGKMDRRALPEPDWSGATAQGEFVAPSTPLEEQLASIWSEVLSIERVGAQDDFFNLGGNSLLALRLASRVRQVFNVELPLMTLFTSPTVAALAEQIVALLAGDHRLDVPPILPAPREGPVRASFAQEPFWFVQQMSPSATILNMHGALPMTGELDLDALRGTINEIIRRHESLRTRFVMTESGELMQVIAPQMRIDVPVEDLGHLPEQERRAQMQRLSREQASEPFDLAARPPLRVRLLRLSNTEHVLMVTIHHVVCDGWSLDVLAREVAQIYDAMRSGRPSRLPPLPIQYADYAIWQRNYMQGEKLESLLGYWRNKLAGLEPLELPTDRPRRVMTQHIQQMHEFMISNRLKLRLGRLCSSQGVTPYMLLLAAFQVLLHRYTDSDDIAVGSPSANRRQQETYDMIGLFINTLVMRNDLSGDPTFREFLARVQQTAIEAYDHEEMRFERLAKELHPEHDLTKQPLVQVLFSFHQRTSSQRVERRRDLAIGFDDINLSLEGAEVFDLALAISDADQGFQAQFEYDESLFDHQTIVAMTAHFETLLEALAADPDQRLSQLPLLSPSDRERLLVEWNQAPAEAPQALCVHQVFEAQAERTPEAVALRCDAATMSYRQLNAQANQLAYYLHERGVGPEVPVGICLAPSLEMAVAILGVLKAGGVYVPLDPEDPRERLDFFVADSRPAAILTTTGLAERFSAGEANVIRLDAEGQRISQESESNPPCQTSPENAVFVLYTSGSTGKPKGAVNLHRGIANYLLWKRQALGLGPDDRVLLTTPLSFDTSVEEFFSGLLCGGSVVIAKPGSQREPDYLPKLIAREGVTTACFVPSMLRILLEQDEIAECGSLRRVISGGEALTSALMERFFERLSADLYNDYGPTETSIAVTTWKCRRDYPRGVIPIGRPLSHIKLYILDGRRNPVPVGVPGELYIGGIAVGRGYLNRPELTAETFLADPFSNQAGDRLYRTGDRCRYLPDGNIEFLGRRDGQVKIHGSRVELGEVEAALTGHPGVAQAAVVARTPALGSKYLAAYVVPRDGPGQSEEAQAEFVKDLRRFLRTSLPEYVIPQVFEVLDALPQLSSGKVNRAALPVVAPAARLVHRYVAPRSEVECQLATIWAELLRLERVGAYDNFFELGGHSLLAVRLVSRVRSAFSVDLPLITLFASPSLAELAEQIEVLQASGRVTELPSIEPVPRDGRLPATFGQQAWWFHWQLSPQAIRPILHTALRLSGRLEVEALRATINEVVRRHESLRTTFAMTDSGQLVQVITPQLLIELPVDDLRHLPESERERQAAWLSQQQMLEPFDLGKGPLFRAQLLRLDGAEHVLLVTVHHIVFDGWSLEVLMSEVTHIYDAFQAGRPSPLPALPVQFADYAVWQQNYLQGETLDSMLGYWRAKLDGLAELELPADHPRVGGDLRPTRSHVFDFSADLNARLAPLCQAARTTNSMVLLAAFQMLLQRYTGSDDVTVASTAVNRRLPEAQGMIGLFVNTVLFRSDLSGDPSFRELLVRVRQTTIEALDHQELPFERLVAALRPRVDVSKHPFTRVLYNFLQPTSNEQLAAQRELSVEYLPSGGGPEESIFDLTLMLTDDGEGLHGMLRYDTSQFEPSTVARMADDLRTLLEAAVANPDLRLSQLPQLSDGELSDGCHGHSARAYPAHWQDGSATPPQRPYVAPRSPLEKQLAAIWTELLSFERVGLHDDFFALGGRSLPAARMMARAREATGVDLPVAALFAGPTIAELAERVEATRRGETGGPPQEMPLVEELASSLLAPSTGQAQSLAPLRMGGGSPPLFCIHGLGGHIAAFLPLARGLAQGRPVYGLQGQGLDPGQQPHDRIEDMATSYVREIRGAQSHGPYLLAGWSMGGLIALEAAQQLLAAGQEVSLLAMFDTYLSMPEFEKLDVNEQSVIQWIAPQLNLSTRELKRLSLDQQWERIAEQANLAEGIEVAAIRRMAAVCKAHLVACAHYHPQPYQGSVALFRAEVGRGRLERSWKSLCPRLRVESVPGNHYSMLRKPNVDVLAERLNRYLAGAVDGEK
jgi:amino acid adenylation domain-containing protein